MELGDTHPVLLVFFLFLKLCRYVVLSKDISLFNFLNIYVFVCKGKETPI